MIIIPGTHSERAAQSLQENGHSNQKNFERIAIHKEREK